VLYILVRLLLVSFLLLLGLLLIQRIMGAWIGERPDKKKRADDTQRSKGQQRRERRQATPPRAPWWKVLGVSQEASLEEINQHYRQECACTTLIKWRGWRLKSSRLQNGERRN
jgi:hypothetical protein